MVLDPIEKERRLLDEEREALKEEVRGSIGLRKIQLREVQSLLGKLYWTCRIIHMGRVFFAAGCRERGPACGIPLTS